MIPCMQVIISWIYWASQMFFAVLKGQQNIEDLEVMVDQLAGSTQ